MAKNCCKYFTVSLVPVASLTLAVLFGLAIVALPVLYVELAKEYRVCVCVCLPIAIFSSIKLCLFDLLTEQVIH